MSVCVGVSQQIGNRLNMTIRPAKEVRPLLLSRHLAQTRKTRNMICHAGNKHCILTINIYLYVRLYEQCGSSNERATQCMRKGWREKCCFLRGHQIFPLKSLTLSLFVRLTIVCKKNVVLYCSWSNFPR